MDSVKDGMHGMPNFVPKVLFYMKQRGQRPVLQVPPRFVREMIILRHKKYNPLDLRWIYDEIQAEANEHFLDLKAHINMPHDDGRTARMIGRRAPGRYILRAFRSLSKYTRYEDHEGLTVIV